MTILPMRKGAAAAAATACAVVLQSGGCGSRIRQPVEAGGPWQAPVILVVLDSLPNSVLLPESLAGATMLPLAWARLSDEQGEVPDVAGLFLESAMREGMLVATVDETSPMAGSERDDITVVTAAGPDSISIPVTDPPGVGVDMAWAAWDDLGQRSAAVAGMFAKYKPDILVFRCEADSRESAFELSYRWLEAADSLGASLVIYAPPLPGLSRGWAAIAGRHARRGLVEGLTPSGLLNTLRILAGIPWETRLSAGVPAAAALDCDPFRSVTAPR